MARQLVVATGNAGKLRELNVLLADIGVELVAQSELNVEEAEETGLTFLENAIIKARNAANQTGMPAIADDSGIVVDALGGAPGIYSARYAGEHGNDAGNNAKLLDALKDVPDAERTARFFCAAVFMSDARDPCPLVAQSPWEGHIARAARGEHRFGYDPLFIPTGESRSGAEMSASEKNRISHRALAVRALCEQIRARLA